MEMYLIMQAGIPTVEGFMLLEEDEQDSKIKPVLKFLYEETGKGVSIGEAFRESKAFPEYMIHMIEIGERTGYLDSVFKALSLYYERQVAISRTIKSAVVYPAILFVMMILVITVLIVQVLPIFNDVFNQLGSTMSPVAIAFMNFGMALRSGRYIILGVLALIAVICIAVWAIPSLKEKFATWRRKITSKTKLGMKIGTARFASAMSMTMASGLDTDASLEMAQKLTGGSAVSEKIEKCRQLIVDGESFANSVTRTELFEPIYCRMLAIGVKTGAADSVMDEIARRSEENVQISMERTIGKVEPALVIIMSLFVGLVLLSVMLPLMGIMSSIG